MIKGFLPLGVVKSIWLHKLVFQLCLKVNFPYWKIFIENSFAFMNKTLVKYVQPTLVECLSTTCTSKKDPLCLLIFSSTEQKHIAIGLFHAKDTNGVVMFVKLKQVLDKILFTQNIVICVVGKGSNLQTCAITFNLIV